MDVRRAIVKALLEEGRDIIHRDYRRDCCIDATAIILDVLDFYHVRARALACRFFILNKQGAAFAREHGMPNDAASEAAWLAAGCKLIQCGMGGENGYNGHLVAIAEFDEPTLIDLTLDQANRPAFGIDLEPLIVTVPPEFMRGEDSAEFEGANAIIGYQPQWDRQDYQECVAWQSRSRRKPTVRAIIQEVKRNLRERP